MIDVKNEIQFAIVAQTLEDMANAGFLTTDELARAKRLAIERYQPENVWE